MGCVLKVSKSCIRLFETKKIENCACIFVKITFIVNFYIFHTFPLSYVINMIRAFMISLWGQVCHVTSRGYFPVKTNLISEHNIMK